MIELLDLIKKTCSHDVTVFKPGNSLDAEPRQHLDLCTNTYK